MPLFWLFPILERFNAAPVQRHLFGCFNALFFFCVELFNVALVQFHFFERFNAMVFLALKHFNIALFNATFFVASMERRPLGYRVASMAALGLFQQALTSRHWFGWMSSKKECWTCFNAPLVSCPGSTRFLLLDNYLLALLQRSSAA